jgi:peptide/nickel transport system permease protein
VTVARGGGARRGGWVRESLARYFGRPTNTIALSFLLFVALVALLADFLASDKPIACLVGGRFHLFPNLVAYPELAGEDNQTISAEIARDGGFAVLPPVPYGPNQVKVLGSVRWLEGPSARHLLGTDGSGRDVLARLVHGARSAELVGVGSMIVSALLGVLLGALAAYFGGVADKLVRVLVESLSAFPAFFLILAIQGLLGVASPFQLMIVIAATRFPDVAQVTRAEVLRTVNEEYVDAARALGLPHARILFRHVLPNALGPVIVSATFGVASAILIESTLSFLGYGVLPPTASWGQLLTDAFENEGCTWLAIFPGLVLTATVLCVNLVGEGLREAVDPGE